LELEYCGFLNGYWSGVGENIVAVSGGVGVGAAEREVFPESVVARDVVEVFGDQVEVRYGADWEDYKRAVSLMTFEGGGSTDSE